MLIVRNLFSLTCRFLVFIELTRMDSLGVDLEKLFGKCHDVLVKFSD